MCLEFGSQVRPKSIGSYSRIQNCWVLLGNRTQSFWVLLGAEPNADRSRCQQDPSLLGPAEVGPKAIGSAGQLNPKLLGAAWAAESDLIAKLRSGTAITPNTFGSGYRARMGPTEAEPKAILRRAGGRTQRYWVLLDSQVQSYEVLLGNRTKAIGFRWGHDPTLN
uniref:Uncharacterized protein n=1 Tax=Populus trichocarpa TaxID=3694 RepID=A0A2K1ZQJ2_POPTR